MARDRVSTDIRFSDVAHYVGLSLMKDPSSHSKSGPLAKSAVRLHPLKAQEVAAHQRSVASTTSSAGSFSREDSQKAEKLKTQIEWLRAEQKAEQEQLRRLESCLSDSLLLEKKAQKRAARHREARHFHLKQASEVEEKIHALQHELQASRKTKAMLETSHDLPKQTGVIAGLGPVPARPTSVDDDDDLDINEEGPPPKVNQKAHATADRDFKGASAVAEADAAAVQGAEEENMTLQDYWDAADRERDARSNAGSQNISMSQAGSSMKARSTVKSSGQLSRTRLTFNRPPPLTDEELASRHDDFREQIRNELIEKSDGDAKKAFRKLDLNGSGNVSLQEFADGVRRAGVDWQGITHMNRDREVFKLFDLDKDGVITFTELFPEAKSGEPERVSTPEFWNSWVKRNQDFGRTLDPQWHRDPQWQPRNSEAELQLLFETSESHEAAAGKRKWMEATIRRLKNRGKSDARCREIVAAHLPRGSGPKDREDVQTFSAAEVKSCRKAYNDAVNDRVRKIQKDVYDMKESRRVLHDFKQKLEIVTREPIMRKQIEEDRKTAAASGLLLAGPGAGGNAKDLADPGSGPVKRSLKSIAQECNMDEDSIDELSKEFLNMADKNEMLGKKPFVKLLQTLAPSRTLSDNDLDAWWEQITKAMPAREGPPRLQCDFERFALWYASSEARS
eukprot:TRINITY_DN22768_c0_g2_i1.p1 TRINITY_DN22768_c0_g2~~TRINITY_DN22768_c0_g2_i1.p1  ORF type:complete len:678 (+),score=168.05 TRINITY_DN22768_c0_g2_i1:113-2146(+)